ncbi:hypothetical protein S40285_10243 [Stachybotrys chlorohalonatus IBT 40285]|uniref:Uncharacterized protein n=1 Tax=Stachybotrys chlorohalonatus (strain IBT 40285) TaxID=1283841 RepID=A0A084R318_STAC4|nr:hypothetical protein S40285_10243 [Stachybotrys chlorohalonata IBT 40285]
MHRTSFLQQCIDEVEGPTVEQTRPMASLNPFSQDTLFLNPLPPTLLSSFDGRLFRGILGDPRAQNTAGGAAPPTQENLSQLPRYQNLPTYVATPHYHEKLTANVPTNRNKHRDDMSSYLRQWDTKFSSSSS